jgi:hypothetical protein
MRAIGEQALAARSLVRLGRASRTCAKSQCTANPATIKGDSTRHSTISSTELRPRQGWWECRAGPGSAFVLGEVVVGGLTNVGDVAGEVGSLT